MQLEGIHRRVSVAHVMGTVVSVDVRDGGAGAEAAVERAVASLRHADRTFSTYRPDSEISRLDRGELALADASEDVRDVLRRCDSLRLLTRGFFDARAGGRLDPSGLVKGWAVQRAADLLTRAGLRDFCLSAGGDLVARGGALPEPTWRTGIQHPGDRDALAAVIGARDLAVATSGAYERGAHVLDPHTGTPPRGILSVTVVGPDLGTADAYATAAFAMGAAGPHWTLGLRGVEAMTILEGEVVLCTPGFPVLERSA